MIPSTHPIVSSIMSVSPRIFNRLFIVRDYRGVRCKITIHDSFKQNVWNEKSQEFSTATLKYTVDKLGLDRLLFGQNGQYEKG
jgi:hypothetical protein